MAAARRQPLRSFDDVYEEAVQRTGRPSLLLGNGFSIAADSSFDYRRLLDIARFGHPLTSRRVREVFDTMTTADFEMVVRLLESAAEVLDIYKTVSRTSARIQRDARVLRRELARALAHIHPARIGDLGDARLDSCHDFIARFDEVFTTNYDLLLYWAINRQGRAHFDDGFRRRDGQLLHAEPDNQNVSWLHGAVHLHEELLPGESVTVKNEWAMGMPLVDQLREDLAHGQYPLIVMEGTWQQKHRKITASPYLSNALDHVRQRDGALVTFGWALSSNDLHVMTAIARSRITDLYVGLFGGRKDGCNPETIGEAHRLRAASGDRVAIHFWDTASATVW